ncbi:MAG: bifunctional transaldolase/phosoglucose isomerase [Candidatus Acidiferrales bacterium]
MNKLTYKLPDNLASAVQGTLADWKKGDKVKRLWAGDATLWTNQDESKWTGWLTEPDKPISNDTRYSDYQKLAEDIQKAGFTHAVLLGMGGSSLCVEVFEKTYGKIESHPQMRVLDSTDPAQIRTVERSIDIAKTVFIVASKSGSTLEPNIFKEYFYDLVSKAVGAGEAGKRFIAITDPGSHMQTVAEQGGFRAIFYGVPSIGGRYSALSNFGKVPAAIQGVDLAKFLANVDKMMKACGASVVADQNPGAILGAILGTLQKTGRDKVTIFTSAGISDLGAWLEQLLAESTGKQGKGLIPVDLETIGAPEVYGTDRIFAYVRLENSSDAKLDAAVSALEKAGHPVVHIAVGDTYELGEEFYRWEIATAVAGSVIGINPFNQPDVEASKIETRKLTDQYEKEGKLPAEAPFFEDKGFKLFSDPKNAEALKAAAGPNPTLVSYLKAHLSRIKPNDYFALLAYIERNDEHKKSLQVSRLAVRDKKRVATCLGFGPRFLHSTGQAYKGGPNSGVFLQVTCDDASDLKVPGHSYTFGIVKAAQARGDFQVLADRGRRALRVHLSADVAAGLAGLQQAIAEALS